MSIPSIGIVGAGFVGGAMIRGFSGWTDIKVYDLGKKIGSLKEACSADIIFVCLPTPMYKESGDCNTSIIEESLDLINHIIKNKNKCVVIRSTLPPTFLRENYHRWRKLNIIIFPEFLTARCADLDFINSSRFIFGNKKGKDIPVKLSELFSYRFPNVRQVSMTWEGACLVKYGTNTFFTVKLSFFNELSQIATALNEDHQSIINEILNDGRIGRSHCNIPGHDTYLGWGGLCFLKDNKAYQYFSDKLNVMPIMVKAAWDKNEEVRPRDKLEEEISMTSFVPNTDNNFETWKSIKEYKGRYSISSNGKVRAESRKVKQNRHDSNKDITRSKSSYILKPTIRDGYEKVYLYKDNNTKSEKLVHRLVAETFLRPIEENEEVNHKDYNRQNNRVSNLEILEKTKHRRISRKNKGSFIYTAKLDENKVREIRRSNKSNKELSKIFGVKPKTISDVKCYRIWKHVL